MTGLATAPDGGKIYSVGFDDHVRELDSSGAAYSCVFNALIVQLYLKLI